MENIVFWLIIFGILFFLMLLFLISSLNKIKLSEKKTEDWQEILEAFRQEREMRFRENESLKSELRNTSKNLNDSFFQVNKTVDSKLSESSARLNQQFHKSVSLMEGLGKELGKMSEIGRGIENLNKILKSPKGRGSLGETSLEHILGSIFPHHLWQRQFSILGVGIVDAVVKTSQGHLPIDAKFPFSGFEKIHTAEGEIPRKLAEKEFHRDVRKRIDEVAKYIRPDQKTLDFAILFLPNENLYYEIAVRSGELSTYAQAKKVLISGPNSLTYLLQIVFQAYQSQNFATQAMEALQNLKGVKQQSEKLESQLEILLKHLNNANLKGMEVREENKKLTQQIGSIVANEKALE